MNGWHWTRAHVASNSKTRHLSIRQFAPANTPSATSDGGKSRALSRAMDKQNFAFGSTQTRSFIWKSAHPNPIVCERKAEVVHFPVVQQRRQARNMQHVPPSRYSNCHPRSVLSTALSDDRKRGGPETFMSAYRTLGTKRPRGIEHQSTSKLWIGSKKMHTGGVAL